MQALGSHNNIPSRELLTQCLRARA